MNLPGSEVSNIDNVEVNTASKCSNECQRDDRCKAMTFAKHHSAPGGVCWLKDEVPGKGDTFLTIKWFRQSKCFPASLASSGNQSRPTSPCRARAELRRSCFADLASARP